jgi:hypothetical protein
MRFTSNIHQAKKAKKKNETKLFPVASEKKKKRKQKRKAIFH